MYWAGNTSLAVFTNVHVLFLKVFRIFKVVFNISVMTFRETKRKRTRNKKAIGTERLDLVPKQFYQKVDIFMTGKHQWDWDLKEYEKLKSDPLTCSCRPLQKKSKWAEQRVWCKIPIDWRKTGLTEDENILQNK